MNILLIGNYAPDTFTQHIYDTLTLMNHKVHVYQPGLKTIYSNSNLVKSILLVRQTIYNISNQLSVINKFELKHLKKLLTSEKFELTISVHDFLTPDQVATIKNITKSPVVIWFPDAIINFIVKTMFFKCRL